MNATSPKSSLAKLVLHATRPKVFRVMVLGHSGVGKTGKLVFLCMNEFDMTLMRRKKNVREVFQISFYKKIRYSKAADAVEFFICIKKKNDFYIYNKNSSSSIMK